MSWQQTIRTISPYIPGEQPDKPGIIKLNTNECPYPPAPGVEQRAKTQKGADFRLYPDPEMGELTACLAEYYGLQKEQVFVGVGSDDVLAMAFLTFFQSGSPILFPDVTYSFYEVWAGLFGIPYQTKPLDGEFRMVKEDYLTENGGIIFPNPNAPTGVEENLEFLECIIKHNRNSVVIIDEAYIDFGGTSCLPLVEKYNNLLVVQTFSKSRAMAGMRIGFGMGSEELIRYLKQSKFSFNSYTLNRPALELGVEAVREEAYFRRITSQIMDTREWVKEELRRLGFHFPDSKGNFIFAAHREVPAEELFRALKRKDIYVRHWNRLRIDNYLRITVGTREEMKRFLGCVEEYLEQRRMVHR